MAIMAPLALRHSRAFMFCPISASFAKIMVKQSKIKKVFQQKEKRTKVTAKPVRNENCVPLYSVGRVFPHSTKTEDEPPKKKDREICFFNHLASKAQRRSLLLLLPAAVSSLMHRYRSTKCK